MDRRAWLLIGGALTGAFLVGGAVAKDGSLFGPTVAAWVQAIGSIAAIVSATDIARAEIRRQRLKEKEGTARALSHFAELAFRSTRAVSAAANFTADPTHVDKPFVAFGHEIIALATAREAIDHLPLAQLDVPAGAMSFLVQVQASLILVEGILKKETRLPSDPELVRSQIPLMRDASSKLMNLSNEARKAIEA